MEQNFDPKVVNRVKALAYTENGGKPDVSNLKAGGSGETKSLLQFLPATWKEYSKQISGKDDLPMTPENESVVAYGKIADWLNHGYSDEQIASMWNSGRPNAYKQGNKGINKEGVAYDTPNYVKKFTNYLSEFEGQPQTKTSPEQGGNLGMISNPQSKSPFTLKTKKNAGLMKPQIKETTPI